MIKNILHSGRLVRTVPRTITRSVTQAEIDKYKTDSGALAKWLDMSVIAKKGRVFDADRDLATKATADLFPVVKGYNLDGGSVVLPDHMDAKAKLIVFSFKHYGFTLCRTWIDPFIAKYNVAQLPSAASTEKPKTSGSRAVAHEICFVEYGFLSMAKSVFASNIRSNVDPSQIDKTTLVFGGVRVSTSPKCFARYRYCFTPSARLRRNIRMLAPVLLVTTCIMYTQDFAAQLLLPNVFTGYAYLLDKDNKIRWRGSGQALESEVEALLRCTDELLRER
jgi:hypothetical protein